MENPNLEEEISENDELPKDFEQPAEEEVSEPKKSRKKRSAYEIREETTALGAVFLDFKAPNSSQSVKWQNEWKAIAKYGFFVTSDGCIMPYEYYRKTCKAGDGLHGHVRAAHFFFNRDPDRQQRVNQFGWPEAEEVSHLCHNPDCCNPLHLVIEARWKNWKRHYCGEEGSCDCGRQPPCVRTYTNPQVYKQNYKIENDVTEVKRILAPLREKYNFSILPKSTYSTEDAKSKNRAGRNKRQKKHEAEAKKKAVKKAKTQ